MALILKVGPDIPEISRRSGIPLETVRYLYKEHFLKRRMRVRRELNHEKLGLEHIQFILTSDSELEPLFFNSALQSGVWEELYGNSVYRIIPDNLFFMDHLAPPSLHIKLRGFYRELEDLGAVKVHQTYECTRLTHPRMWVEDYDWGLPGWDFDWSPLSFKPRGNIEASAKCEPVKFDKIDLSMVMQLQILYDQSIAATATKNGIGRSSAYWHFRKHVEERKLFGEYHIDWLGTARDTKTGLVPQQHQSFAGISFIAKNLSSGEMMNSRAYLHSIPYLYGEKVGDSDYYAEMLIPLHSLMEAFEFFSRILRPLKGRARIFTVDQSQAVTYTIHPDLFDEESRQWTYKGDLVLEGIKRALAGRTLDSGLKARGRVGLRSGA